VNILFYVVYILQLFKLVEKIVVYIYIYICIYMYARVVNNLET